MVQNNDVYKADLITLDGTSDVHEIRTSETQSWLPMKDDEI